MRKYLKEETRIELLEALEKSEGRKIIFVDDDGVVCDFDLAAEEISKTLGITAEEFKKQHLYRNKNFYLDLKPLPGAIDAVKLLSDKYEVRILSAPSWVNVFSFTEKRIWMENWFGDWAIKRMDLSFRKDLSMGHYLIDDRLKYGAGDFIGEHIHFGVGKFPNWEAVIKYLM